MTDTTNRKSIIIKRVGLPLLALVSVVIIAYGIVVENKAKKVKRQAVADLHELYAKSPADFLFTMDDSIFRCYDSCDISSYKAVNFKPSYYFHNDYVCDDSYLGKIERLKKKQQAWTSQPIPDSIYVIVEGRYDSQTRDTLQYARRFANKDCVVLRYLSRIYKWYHSLETAITNDDILMFDSMITRTTKIKYLIVVQVSEFLEPPYSYRFTTDGVFPSYLKGKCTIYDSYSQKPLEEIIVE